MSGEMLHGEVRHWRTSGQRVFLLAAFVLTGFGSVVATGDSLGFVKLWPTNPTTATPAPGKESLADVLRKRAAKAAQDQD